MYYWISNAVWVDKSFKIDIGLSSVRDQRMEQSVTFNKQFLDDFSLT